MKTRTARKPAVNARERSRADRVCPARFASHHAFSSLFTISKRRTPKDTTSEVWEGKGGEGNSRCGGRPEEELGTQRGAYQVVDSPMSKQQLHSSQPRPACNVVAHNVSDTRWWTMNVTSVSRRSM
jgi:hypothetical protein